jgi:hypothetical protein
VVIGIGCSLAPMMIPTPRNTVRLAMDRLAYAARLNTLAYRSVVEGFLCTHASRSQIFHARTLKTIKVYSYVCSPLFIPRVYTNNNNAVMIWLIECRGEYGSRAIIST